MTKPLRLDYTISQDLTCALSTLHGSPSFPAFVVWFAIPSIMPTIKKSLKLTKYQVYVTNILSVLATIFMRFLVGPLCDKYGPRAVMTVTLIIGSIPTYLIGCVTTFEGLAIIRFFIGTIGATFVMCQYWTTAMFTKVCLSLCVSFSLFLFHSLSLTL
jgi:nitrate/nitrite transporter NarK